MQRPGGRGAALAAAAALLILAVCSSAPEQMKCATRDGVTVYDGMERRIWHETCADGALHISVCRQDGSIGISVLQMERQEYVYRGTDLPTSKFFVLLPEAGEYRIEIRAEHFQGSFDVTGSTRSSA